MVEEQVSTINQLGEITKQLAPLADEKLIWLFHGEMGAGKTTFIKELCKEFGVLDNVGSPTFSVVNEYRGKNDRVIYHFDFYRLEDEEEAYDIGLEEYLESGAICFLEWPDKVSSLLPDDCLNIYIKLNADQSRTITAH